MKDTQKSKPEALKEDAQMPNTLHELLAVALLDSAAIEAMPDKYRMYMGQWLRRGADSRCEVCLAGAVFVQRLCALELNQLLRDDEGTHSAYIMWRALNAHDALTTSFMGMLGSKLSALDALRTGDVCGAWSQLYLHRYQMDKAPAALQELKLKKWRGHVGDYTTDPAKWRQQMEELQADLKALGV